MALISDSGAHEFSKLLFPLLGLSAALAILGTSASAKDLTFGYVAGSLKYPYNVATADGFKEAAAEAGVKAIVLDPQGDANTRALKDVYPKLNALITPDDFVAGEQGAKLALTMLPTDRKVKIAIVEGAPGYSKRGLRTLVTISGISDAT